MQRYQTEDEHRKLIQGCLIQKRLLHIEHAFCGYRHQHDARRFRTLPGIRRLDRIRNGHRQDKIMLFRIIPAGGLALEAAQCLIGNTDLSAGTCQCQSKKRKQEEIFQ